MGHPLEATLPLVDIDADTRVLDAFYAVSERVVGVLAWLQATPGGDTVVALTITPPSSARSLSLRRERLAGQDVLIQDLTWACAIVPSDVFMPSVEARSWTAHGRQMPRPRPEECPSKIERVWVRRGNVLQMVGAYPIAGEQALREGMTVRSFSSTTRCEGELIHVHEQATWRWFTGKSRAPKGDSAFELELKGESESGFERTFRFGHDSLQPVNSGIGAIPIPHAPRMRWLATNYAVTGTCAGINVLPSGEAR